MLTRRFWVALSQGWLEIWCDFVAGTSQGFFTLVIFRCDLFQGKVKNPPNTIKKMGNANLFPEALPERII